MSKQNTTQILDLSALPPPEVIKPLGYEARLARMKANFLKFAPECEQALTLESNVITKILQYIAYEFELREQQENEEALAVMLPHAKGADLENLAAFYEVKRLVITPEDTTTVPPTPAVLESDEDLRRRAQLSPKSFSTAGPPDAYLFYALSASGQVKDAFAESPQEGHVLVVLLSRSENGHAPQELIDTVYTVLRDEQVAPMTDHITVKSADIVDYTIKAVVYTGSGPSPEIVKEQVQASIEAYTQKAHLIGQSVPHSGIVSALHINGVNKVKMVSPAPDMDIAVSKHQAAYCTGIELEFKEGSGDDE